jgi:helix-turn-helix protein
VGDKIMEEFVTDEELKDPEKYRIVDVDVEEEQESKSKQKRKRKPRPERKKRLTKRQRQANEERKKREKERIKKIRNTHHKKSKDDPDFYKKKKKEPFDPNEVRFYPFGITDLRIPMEMQLSPFFTQTDKIVCAFIRCFPENGCWLTYRTIADTLKLAIPTIMNSVTKLIELGIIGSRVFVRPWKNMKEAKSGRVLFYTADFSQTGKLEFEDEKKNEQLREKKLKNRQKVKGYEYLDKAILDELEEMGWDLLHLQNITRAGVTLSEFKKMLATGKMEKEDYWRLLDSKDFLKLMREEVRKYENK